MQLSEDDVKETYKTIMDIFKELAGLQKQIRQFNCEDELKESVVMNRLGFAQGFFYSIKILGFISDKEASELIGELNYDRFCNRTYWIDNLSIKG